MRICLSCESQNFDAMNIKCFLVDTRHLYFITLGSDGTVFGWVSTNLDIGADERSRSVSGLRPARKYQFRVFAENKIGEGEPSTPKPDVPIEMPQQRKYHTFSMKKHLYNRGTLCVRGFGKLLNEYFCKH